MTTRARSWTRWPLRGLGLLLLLALAVAAFGWWRLDASRPVLSGEVAAPGLGAPVQVVRDANGVPTLTGQTRGDLAWGLGWLHGQERFFQMDLLRRTGAGELSALLGGATQATDRKLRLHRFRTRAAAEIARMDPASRAVLDAYVAGVNRGLGDLHAAPFEYALLRHAPEPWRAADTMLVVYAMYFGLQGPDPKLQLDRARAAARLGQPMADLLYPQTTELDSAIDGTHLPEPPMPARMTHPVPRAATIASIDAEPFLAGSNNWAVSGAHSATGGAMVANDMHLALNVPNIWYRTRLRMPGLDITGVTLPGTPQITVGSNGRIAWGFTNSYAALHDAVILDPVPGAADIYRTPGGPRAIVRAPERLCVGAVCSTLVVEETIWGPVVARLADGRRVADRWIAHDPGAIRLETTLALERAQTAAEALALGHRAGMPDQNLTVGDREGHIGWTIAGQLPARFGFTGRDASSWADGTRGWAGYLPADKVPTVLNPPSGRIWTANARVIGGAGYALLGDGGYDTGARAGEIARRLAARERFDERDMLAIQLDDVSLRNRFWADELARVIVRTPGLAAWAAPVRAWNGRADDASVGYRLIAQFRRQTILKAFDAYVGPADEAGRGVGRAAPQSEGAMRRLLRARPPGLVPPGYAGWDALEAAATGAVLADIAKEAGGDLGRYTWGGYMRAGVRHPLSAAVPGLKWLTDPPDEAVNGDSGTPRAQYPGGGPSERIAVSPGHEERGLFQMPGGQAGNPLSPYYLGGHEDWVRGTPTPFLPGPPRWTLTLVPAKHGTQ